jgi:hypothetical protein
MTKRWGLPNGNGWANEPASLIDALTAIDCENDKMDSEEMNSKMPKDKNSNVDKFKRA